MKCQDFTRDIYFVSSFSGLEHVVINIVSVAGY